MRRFVIASILLSLASLACTQAVVVPTDTPTAPTASPTAAPDPTVAPSPVPTEAEDQTVVVRQPVVRVRDAADGLPTGEYILAGQRVTVLAIDGDWVQIAEPPGWVYIGCLEGLSEKGCEADE